jgi:hypothetical protein
MTKIRGMKAAERVKPGPKPKPEEARAVKKTVSLKPETHDGLLTLGGGVLSHGVELAYQAATKRAAGTK